MHAAADMVRAALALSLVLTGCGNDGVPPADRSQPAPFSEALCAAPEPTSREQLLDGVPVGSGARRAAALDDRALYGTDDNGKFFRFVLPSGAGAGVHDLGAARSRRFFNVIGSDGDRIYVWSVSNIETTSERIRELIVIDFATRQDTTLLSEPSERPSRTPLLLDRQAIYWSTTSAPDPVDLVATDLRGASPRTLVAGLHFDQLAQDRETLYWTEYERVGSDGRPEGIRIRKLSKQGGEPATVATDLPLVISLIPSADDLLFQVQPAPGSPCDRTVFAVGKDRGPVRSLARGPTAGSFVPYRRGVLWGGAAGTAREHAGIWTLDPARATATMLIGPTGTVWGPALAGVHQDWLYYERDEGLFRARLP
jgi:hypothetical protein